MVDTVTVTKTLDSARNAIFHLTNISDGSGEFNVKKINIGALAADKDLGPATGLVMEKLYFSTVGMAVQLIWEGGTDHLAWVIPRDEGGVYDWSPLGWLPNNALAPTGSLLLTTIDAVDRNIYSIVVHVRKKYGG